jgi:hypothetical protein
MVRTRKPKDIINKSTDFQYEFIKKIHISCIDKVVFMSKKSAIISILSGVAFLAACTPAGGTTPTNAPTDKPTIETVSPTIESLFVDDLELTGDERLYTLPGDLSPGSAMELELTIDDDSPGQVTIGTLRFDYEPGTPASERYFIPKDQMAHELPLTIDGDDGGQAAYVLLLAPENSKPVVAEVDADHDFDMGTIVELELTFADLDGDELSIAAEQYFTRGVDAVPSLKFQDYISNFVLDFDVEMTDTGAIVRFDAPMPGFYALQLAVQDEDGWVIEQDLVVSIVPTIDGILSTKVPMIGAWFKFHPAEREWAAFEEELEHDMVIVHTEFQSFCTHTCYGTNHLEYSMGWVIEANKIPMISFDFYLHNWDFPEDALPQPTLQDIIDGELDTDLRRFARSLASFDAPILWVNGWEFNISGSDDTWRGPRAFGPEADQFYWQTSNMYTFFGDPAVADGPERYVETWRHIYDIFRENGADNVLFVWNPNWTSDPSASWNTFENYWPGDEYVDIIGPSVYNYAWENRDFTRLWNHEIAPFLANHLGIPVIIRELGSDTRGNPPYWHATALSEIASFPEIIGVSFFSEDMDGNYAFHTYTDKIEAVREELNKGNFGDSQ